MVVGEGGTAGGAVGGFECVRVGWEVLGEGSLLVGADSYGFVYRVWEVALLGGLHSRQRIIGY